MLGKKMGVLFTISSGNFELKQGKEYRALQLLRILRLSLSPCSSVLVFNNKFVIILFPFFINLI